MSYEDRITFLCFLPSDDLQSRSGCKFSSVDNMNRNCVLVVSAISWSSRTLLGPRASVKFHSITNENGEEEVDARMIADGFSLVQVLNIRHPVGSLIRETTCGQQVKTLRGFVTVMLSYAGGGRYGQLPPRQPSRSSHSTVGRERMRDESWF